MARPRPERKPPAEQRVLPMQVKIGDRVTDERGEWRVIGRPHTTLGGKSAHVRVELVEQPNVIEVKTWGAHERVSVKRGTAQEGNQ
jgi:hypothetical protein